MVTKFQQANKEFNCLFCWKEFSLDAKETNKLKTKLKLEVACPYCNKVNRLRSEDSSKNNIVHNGKWSNLSTFQKLDEMLKILLFLLGAIVLGYISFHLLNWSIYNGNNLTSEKNVYEVNKTIQLGNIYYKVVNIENLVPDSNSITIYINLLLESNAQKSISLNVNSFSLVSDSGKEYSTAFFMPSISSEIILQPLLAQQVLLVFTVPVSFKGNLKIIGLDGSQAKISSPILSEGFI